MVFARFVITAKLVLKENEAFVVIPLTRSINPATRRYLDVESETKRVRQWIQLNIDDGNAINRVLSFQENF